MYIRALELSQNATVQDASPDEQAQLEKSKQPAAPTPAPAAPAPVKSASTKYQGHFSIDVGYQFQTNQPPNKPMSGPLRLDYGVPYNSEPAGGSSNGTKLADSKIRYLNQHTVKGWIDISIIP
jgi:hypothetical protein